MKSFLSFVCLAALLTGCSGGSSSDSAQAKPSDSSPVAAKPAFVAKEHKVAGLTIQLPEDWVAVDLTSQDLDKILEKMVEENPNLKSASEGAKAAASSGAIKIMAFDVKNGSEKFTDNMNVNILPLPDAKPTLEQLANANIDQIMSMGKMDKPKLEVAPVGESEMAHLSWNLPMTGPDGVEQKLAFETYIFIRGDEQVTFTFSSMDARSKKFAETAKEIMGQVGGTKG